MSTKANYPNPSPELVAAWQKCLIVYGLKPLDHNQWEMFKFGWDEAMEVCRKCMDGN